MQGFIYEHKGMIEYGASRVCTGYIWHPGYDLLRVWFMDWWFFFSVHTDLGSTNQNVPKHATAIPPNESLDSQHPVIWEGMHRHSRSSVFIIQTVSPKSRRKEKCENDKFPFKQKKSIKCTISVGLPVAIIAERRNFFYLENSSCSLYLWFTLSCKAGDSVKWWGEFCYLVCFPLSLRMASSNKSLPGGVILYLELPCLKQWCRKEVRWLLILFSLLALMQLRRSVPQEKPL